MGVISKASLFFVFFKCHVISHTVGIANYLYGKWLAVSKGNWHLPAPYKTSHPSIQPVCLLCPSFPLSLTAIFWTAGNTLATAPPWGCSRTLPSACHETKAKAVWEHWRRGRGQTSLLEHALPSKCFMDLHRGSCCVRYCGAVILWSSIGIKSDVNTANGLSPTGATQCQVCTRSVVIHY